MRVVTRCARLTKKTIFFKSITNCFAQVATQRGAPLLQSKTTSEYTRNNTTLLVVPTTSRQVASGAEEHLSQSSGLRWLWYCYAVEQWPRLSLNDFCHTHFAPALLCHTCHRMSAYAPLYDDLRRQPPGAVVLQRHRSGVGGLSWRTLLLHLIVLAFGLLPPIRTTRCFLPTCRDF